jgi:hypothetical protein
VRLPNAHLATIDLRKLREYSLNPDHPRGAHKARVFASALGYTFNDAEHLREEILRAAVSQEAIKIKDDRYGSHYVVDFGVRRSSRSVIVRTCWLVADEVGIPRLTSCFVL